MPLYLVTIQDKSADGEPDIGFMVVEAQTADSAVRISKAVDQCYALSQQGKRCVPHAKALAPGEFYRVGAFFRGR